MRDGFLVATFGLGGGQAILYVCSDPIAMKAATPCRESNLKDLSHFKSRLPHLSQAALAAILKISKDEPLPKLARRGDIRDARNALVQTTTPFGPLHQHIPVPKVGGGCLMLEVQHPFAMLYEMCRSSRCYSDLVERTFAKHPSTPAKPWGVCFYNDEVTAGNLLRKQNPRKLEAFYWSFLEFGAAALSDEEAWFEVAVLKSDARKHLVQGGVSALAGAVLRAFFDAESHDLSTAGILVELHGGRMLQIWARLECVLADEAALHAIMGCKGSGGLRCCLLCSNVFNTRYVDDKGMLAEHQAVTHSCSDASRLKLHTDASIFAVIATLRERQPILNAADFEKLSMQLGWNLGSMLETPSLRRVLRPSQQTLFDWMHTMFSNGVFNTHCGVMIVALKALGICPEMIHAYVGRWKWPHRVSTSTGVDAFAPHKIKATMQARSLKCQASEGFSLYPVLANYAEHALSKSTNTKVRAHARCFLLLTGVIDLVVSSSRYQVDTCVLQEHIGNYLSVFRKMYGEEHMHPKFHYLLHFSMFLRRWGSIPNCFCLERKHRLIKRFANDNKNVTLDRSAEYSSSVLREVTCHHLQSLKREPNRHFSSHAELVDAHPPSTKLLKLLNDSIGAGPVYTTAAAARINQWEHIHINDVVLFSFDGELRCGAVELLAASAFDGSHDVFCAIDTWTLVSKEHRRSIWTNEPSRLVFVAAEDLTSPVTFSASHGRVDVIHPPSRP